MAKKKGGSVQSVDDVLVTSVDLAADVTGTLPVANGGTGQSTFTNGQLLIGNTTGNTLTKATLTAGSGISITNGAGSIEIAASPGGASPDGYTYIVASGDEDVTNAGLTNHSEFAFSTTANGFYAISMDLFLSGSSTSADFTMDFRVSAGTMRGKGTVQNLTAAAAVQNIIMTAAAAANTTAIVTGAPTADLNDPVFVRIGFCCRVTNTTTLTFRFGNATPTVGQTSRVLAQSVMRYKQLL